MTDDSEKVVRVKMDKKNLFPTSFPANTNKALNLDSSSKSTAFTKQDGTPGSQVSKVQPRPPARYRGTQSSNANYSRNDPSNFRYKTSSQKGKGYFDKKPKGRGGGTAAESVESRKPEPEVGSLQAPGRKKPNIEDLWGFQFAKRSPPEHFRQSHAPGGGLWRLRCENRLKYAKDYLLANCQFLVRVGEDYSVYLADPNLLVKWDLIEEVRIRVEGEMPKCPICLDTPVAAKITKCGHIYCWTCFLHYLALTDNHVRTCPICYEPVGKRDLKSVSLISQEGIEIGTRMEMQLMTRKKDATVATPVENFYGWERRFSKILQVVPKTLIRSVLVREHDQLDNMFAEDPNAPEVCFIQQALEELGKREVELLLLHGKFCDDLEVPEYGLLPADMLLPASGSGFKLHTVSAETDLTKKKIRNDSVSSTSSGGYDDTPKHLDDHGDCYFFQMCDGRNVFLHPMNMAMLWRELGPDPERWPQILRFEIIDIESKSASEEVRKRLKCVRHMPMNAPFDLVEVSMDGWGISPHVYADFESQINIREQRRQNRAKEERIMERKQREREAQEFNKYRVLPEISSTQEFPAFGTTISEQELVYATIQEELASSAAMQIIPEHHEFLRVEPLHTSTSFAQIASKAPIKKSPTFPICGGTSVSSKESMLTVARHSDSENDCEDYVPVPNYRASVSDAIERALAQLDLVAPDESQKDSPTASGNKKKKNKNKGKVLFATGMGPFN